MLSRNRVETQPEADMKKPGRIFQYSQSGGFAFMMSTGSTSAWLEEQEYRELPGAYGIVRSFESDRLAYKFAVVVSYPDEDCIFWLNDYQYNDFMVKHAPLVGVLRGYLPWAQGIHIPKQIP